MGKAVKPTGGISGGKRGSRTSGHAKTELREFASPLDRAKGYEVVWPQVSELFAVMRDVLEVSFVYFIGETEDKGPLKIGVAKDPISRLRQMQIGNPRRLKVEQALVGDRDTEALLHEIWEDFAIRSAGKRGKLGAPGTEWFQPEIRDQLLPVIATAAEDQVFYLDRRDGGPIYLKDLETIVRAAHGKHGVIGKTSREEMRFLAPVAGYATGGRESRL